MPNINLASIIEQAISILIALGIFQYLLKKKLLKFQSSLSKEETIHKLKFEKDFEIHSELWAILVDLREATKALVPGLLDQGKSKKETIERREAEFKKAYNIALSTLRKKEPYYDRGVYENSDEILMLSSIHGKNYTHPQAEREKNVEETRERIKKIYMRMDVIKGAIRDKIEIKEKSS